MKGLSRGTVVWGLCAAAVGFTLSRTGMVPIPNGRTSSATPSRTEIPFDPSVGGQQLALVYIGHSRCRASNHPELPALIRRIRATMHTRALGLGFSSTAIGVAVDFDVAAGVEHLERFESFDEILVGNGTLNTGALRWLFQDLPGEAATPQLLVLQRPVLPDPDVGLGEDRLLLRLIGIDEIFRWQDNGAPLARLDSTEVP